MTKFNFKKVPVDSDGKAYDSLESFQVAEIKKIIGTTLPDDHAAEDIVARKVDVIEILELTMDARPAARGQKRPRKPKTSAEPTALNLVTS